MNKHTLILSTARIIVHKESVVIDVIENLIKTDLTIVKYFGLEIDNDVDYEDEETKDSADEFSFINFYFDTDEVIDYKSISNIEAEQLILELISNSTNIETRWHGKDITVYL